MTFLVIYALPDNPTVTFTFTAFAKDELEAFQIATKTIDFLKAHPDWIVEIRERTQKDAKKFRPPRNWIHTPK